MSKAAVMVDLRAAFNSLAVAIVRTTAEIDRFSRCTSFAYRNGYRIDSKHGRNVLVKMERRS